MEEENGSEDEGCEEGRAMWGGKKGDQGSWKRKMKRRMSCLTQVGVMV